MRKVAPLSILAFSSAALLSLSVVSPSSPVEASPGSPEIEAGYSPVDTSVEGFRGGVYKFVPVDNPGVQPTPEAHATTPITSQTIFLNNCLNADCTFKPAGVNDSRNNESSIIDRTSAVTPWQYDQATWDDTVACVQNMFAPFNVTVTDIEPSGPHHEAIVSGSPGQIGMPNGVLGVAPFSCGIIHNAITFNFADVASSVEDLCFTIGQEVAHGWGLDHEFLCEDPMTYLFGCGVKSFQNVDAPCGENSARQCMCGGGSTQNSVAMINNVFASGDPVAPAIVITEPAASASVEPGFPIRADITDAIAMDKVQFFVNGTLVGESTRRPFVANAPADLNQGAVDVEVVASNMAGAESRISVTAIYGERCSDDSCPDGQACWAGACVNTNGEGGLGTECTDGSECDSGLCAQGSDRMLCTDDCRQGECPSGFECVAAGSREICWPESSGGCSATDVRSGPLFPVLIALFGAFLLGFRRSRRSSRCESE